MDVRTRTPQTQRVDHVLARRRLARSISGLRARAGVTQQQVASAMGWSPAKVLRIENAQSGIDEADLRRLLEYFGVENPAEVEAFVRMRRRRPSPFASYRNLLGPDFIRFLDYEAAALLGRYFETRSVPALLQTEMYARNLIMAERSQYDIGSESFERLTEARLQRQRILVHPSPPQLSFILDEAVVRRSVIRGGGDLGAQVLQLEHLKDLAQRPHVSIQILPFSVGMLSLMPQFYVVLEFADVEDATLLFRPDEVGRVVAEDDAESVYAYINHFNEAESLATPRDETVVMLDRIIDEIRN
jgi:transcriptional regulator with XRE-family HTH domain